MSSGRLKFLVLTDSIANPRSFPIESSVALEETYPYLIRDMFPDAIFWQLSYGDIASNDLINQAISYLNNWNPDYIIVHSGINDCRPEAFTEFQKTIIHNFPGFISKRLRKYIYHPPLVKARQIRRVSKQKFNETLAKFKMIFNKSKIFWIEICFDPHYASARPGVISRMNEYNQIIERIYGENMIHMQSKLMAIEGFNVDNMHFNKRGHRVAADILLEKINIHLQTL